MNNIEFLFNNRILKLLNVVNCLLKYSHAYYFCIFFFLFFVHSASFIIVFTALHCISDILNGFFNK